MSYKLKDVCSYAKDRIALSNLTIKTYISTENMLSEKGGVVVASGLPTTPQVAKYQPSDVLISNIRPYFKKIWYANKTGGCSNDVLVVRSNEKYDSLFLYYVLSNDEFFSYSTATAKGTKMPRGDKTAIMDYDVPNIPLAQQKEIGKLLSSFDRKIQQNNKINDYLEQMAQAIFKSWFVDFEPFQDGEFYDTELGSIPKGWTIVTFSEIISKTLNGDWGKESSVGNNTQEVYCIRGADIPEVKKGNKGKMPVRYILPKNFDTKQLKANDIVIEISGGSPTQSTGRVAIISQALLDRYDKGMICTNFCKAIEPIENYSTFTYYYWQFLYNQNVMYSYENGTTGIKNFDTSGFLESEPIVIPPKEVTQQFEKLIIPLFEQIFLNGSESEALAQTRDALLPKLMSGEISIADL